jgi:hypothetical protein
MRKKNLFLGKRCLTFFSVLIAVFASLTAFGAAGDDSEYCRSRIGNGANSYAYINVETNAEGQIIMEIIPYDTSLEDATHFTAFRNWGWNDARAALITVNGNSNTDNAYFTRTVTGNGGTNHDRNKTKLIFTPVSGMVSKGDVVVFPGGASYLEWETPLNDNVYLGTPLTYTYGSNCDYAPKPAALATPDDLEITEGALTFTGDEDASSHTVFVYMSGINVYQQPNFTSGDVVNYTTPGEYTIRIRSIGDNGLHLNSDYSDVLSWTVSGDIPPLDTSEYCYLYWNSGLNAAILTWETLKSGNIAVTMSGFSGNEATWRGASLAPANFKLGPLAVSGADFLNVAFAGNVCTISPKDGVTLPEGFTVQYQGNVEYVTTNGNITFAGNFTYTYGSNCATVNPEKLETPANVSVDSDGKLTFNAVDHAATYNAFVYSGANIVYRQIPVVSGDALNFPLPGTFNVYVTAIPDATETAIYEESDPSEPYAWTVNWQTPATVPASPYCDYEVNPNGTGNSVANGNADWGDHDGTYWSWTTDAEGQLVISINSAFHPEEYPEPRFRANGMSINNFRIGGVPGNLLLEKIGGNTGNTQTFRAKEGVTFLPGIEITYSGVVEYLIITPKPVHDPVMPGNIADLYPTLTFSDVYIYGANCSGEATVLATPENLAVAEDKLTFDAVTGAVTYKVYVYDAEKLLVYTQGNYASDDLLTYNVPGHYTVKVQAIGNAGTYINSGLSDEEAWDLVAALEKPVGLRINTENKLTFPPVPAAVSYTVTIYDAADATVETIPEFESGTQLDMGEANYGTTYTVKVQAIGDGDVILDSELSDAYTWNFEEPYVCNLLLEPEHALIVGTDAITFPDIANGGVLKGTAPYFAPGWDANPNYTIDVTDNVVSIHLGVATGAEWQAQFRILPEAKVLLKAGELYDIRVKVKTSKSTSVYAKIFEYDDNAYTDLIARQAIDAPDGKVFELFGVAFPTGMNSVFQFLFDFGGNPADVDIELSDFVICGEEGITVGINEIGLDKVSVYPVPAQDILHVSGLDAAKEVRVIDVTGHALSVRKVDRDAIDVSGLAKGIYILSIDGKAVKFTKN